MNAENELDSKSIPKEMLAFMSAFFRENHLTTESYFFQNECCGQEPKTHVDGEL